jgi:hypothetical protein
MGWGHTKNEIKGNYREGSTLNSPWPKSDKKSPPNVQFRPHAYKTKKRGEFKDAKEVQGGKGELGAPSKSPTRPRVPQEQRQKCMSAKPEK